MQKKESLTHNSTAVSLYPEELNLYHLHSTSATHLIFVLILILCSEFWECLQLKDSYSPLESSLYLVFRWPGGDLWWTRWHGQYSNGSCFHTFHLCRGWTQWANSNMRLILSTWNLHPHLVIHPQFLWVAPFFLPLGKSRLRFAKVVSFQLKSRQKVEFSEPHIWTVSGQVIFHVGIVQTWDLITRNIRITKYLINMIVT